MSYVKKIYYKIIRVLENDVKIKEKYVTGWMDGSKSGFKDCLQQSKILTKA